MKGNKRIIFESWESFKKCSAILDVHGTLRSRFCIQVTDGKDCCIKFNALRTYLLKQKKNAPSIPRKKIKKKTRKIKLEPTKELLVKER